MFILLCVCGGGIICILQELLFGSKVALTVEGLLMHPASWPPFAPARHGD